MDEPTPTSTPALASGPTPVEVKAAQHAAYDFLIKSGVKDPAGRGAESAIDGISGQILARNHATYGGRGPRDAGPTLLKAVGPVIGGSADIHEAVQKALAAWARSLKGGDQHVAQPTPYSGDTGVAGPGGISGEPGTGLPTDEAQKKAEIKDLEQKIEAKEKLLAGGFGKGVKAGDLVEGVVTQIDGETARADIQHQINDMKARLEELGG